jgi:predicted nucleic acid-binding Zn ribbon protein
MDASRDNDDELQSICDDIRRRQRYRPAPKAIADVLSSLLARRGYARERAVADCRAAWRQAAGTKLAEHSCAGNIRRGVLEVTVRNSAVAQELTFLKKKLLQELNRLAPDQSIRDLRIRVGELG